MPKTVSIKPGVNVLAVLRHLNYKPWYALAEFVDNAVESFVTNKLALSEYADQDVLRVKIDVDTSPPARITIRDNAAGIAETEYGRAFRPAAIPENRSGLAEFGMGMKSAACWFSPEWTVRTSALGESFMRTVHFDIQNIVNDGIDELMIQESNEHVSNHYTEITLHNVFQVPVGRTIGKIKEHLADIYREFLRNGILELSFNGEQLEYREPDVLKAPYYRDKDGPQRTWHKRIEFDFGDGLSVRGFAALRQPGSTSKAGFSLFRRDRVIQGSGDEKYRPHLIFGSPNRYCYQRMFGELHLCGFDVSHTKDGFRWDQNEQPFLELLREHLNHGDLPLITQANGYRIPESSKRVRSAVSQAVDTTTDVMKEQLPTVLPSVSSTLVGTPEAYEAVATMVAGREFEIEFRGIRWIIAVEVTADPSIGEWVSIMDQPAKGQDPRRLGIRLSVVHPFTVRFAQADAGNVEGLLRVAAAIGLAEVLARDAGVRFAGTVRRNVNEILREALSEP